MVVPLYADLNKESPIAGSVWVAPLFVEAYGKAMPDHVATAMATFNRSNFFLNKGKKSWDDRSATYEQFMTVIGVPGTPMTVVAPVDDTTDTTVDEDGQA